MTANPGPAPGWSLAGCHARGCRHRECAHAAAAAARLADPSQLAGAVGTRRRLRALAAYGWSPAELGRRLQISRQSVTAVMHRRGTVTPALAAAVRGLYDELWDVPGGSPATAAAARTRGWPPPLGWDDGNEDGHGIDDPGAVPAPGWRPTGQAPRLADRIEDLAELTRQGCIAETAARRMGLSPASIHKLTSRHRQAMQGQAVPAELAS